MNDTLETQTPIAPLTLRERIAAWWAPFPRDHLAAILALAAVFAVATLLVTCSQEPDLKQATQPAAVQTNPLAPLVARIEAIEAQVADLQDLRTVAAPRASVRRAPAVLAAAPSEPVAQAPQAPTAQPWGTTDLDRAIALHKRVIPELFPANTTTGAQK